MFVGAAVGGMIVASDPEAGDGDGMFGQVVERTERLERMLTPPG